VLQVRGTALNNLGGMTVNWSTFAGGFDINNNGNVFTVTNDINGNFLLKRGMGLLVLGGNGGAALTGLVVQAGPLLFTNGAAVGFTNLVLAGGGMWLGSNIVTDPRLVTLIGGGAFAPAGGAVVAGGDGALRNIGGNNTYTGPIVLAGAARINADAGSALYLAGTISNAANLLTFGGYGDIIVSTNITGTGGLAKDGRGTLTLQNLATNAFGNATVAAGTLRLDYNAAGGTVVSNLVATGAVLTLGTTAFSISTGGALVVNGPAAGGAITQTFSGLTVAPGLNTVSNINNGGDIFLNFSNITRAVGGGIVNFALPGGAGAISTLTGSNYAFLLGGGNIALVDGTNWATALGAGPVYTIGAYSAYTDRQAGQAIATGSNTNVRILGGGSGNVTLGSAVTEINSLLVADPGAVITNALPNQWLRLGQTGAILVTPDAGGLIMGAVPHEGVLTAGGNTNTAGELVLINQSATPLIINSRILSNATGAITVTVNGRGPVTFAGNNAFNQFFGNAGNVTFTATNTFFGATPMALRDGLTTFGASSTNTLGGGVAQVDGGAGLRILGAAVVNTQLQVGVTAGSRATLGLGGAGVLTFTNTRDALKLGVASGAAGAFYQTGGLVTITMTNVFDGGNIGVGQTTGGYGYYRLTNGTVLNNARMVVGYGAGAIGVFDMTGGSISNREWTLLAYAGAGAVGIANIFGGTFQSSEITPFSVSSYSSPAYGVLNIGGGGLVNAAMTNNQPFSLMGHGGSGATGGTGIVNLLSGGTLIVNQVSAGAFGTPLLNFNGGTLKANPGYISGTSIVVGTTLGTNFMRNLGAANMAAVIYENGGVIDSDTNVITITAPIQGAVGFGLTNIAVLSGGAGYIGAPAVMISGGSGTGATAIAQVDLDPSSVTYGRLTNIVITSRGSGYQPNDAVNIFLLGGGAIQPGQLGAFTFGANTAGDLTKTGMGTLVLAGTNTYNRTILSQGVLQIGEGTDSGTLGFGAVTNRGAVIFNRAGAYQFGGAIDGTGRVAVAGVGNIILTNINAYSGGTLLSNGALLISATNAAGVGAIAMSGGGIGPTNAAGLNQAFIDWLNGRAAGTLTGAGLLTGNSSASLSFVTNIPAAGLFLGAALNDATFSGSAVWTDSVVRLGGGSAALIYTPRIGAGTNLAIGPVGGNSNSVVQLTGVNRSAGSVVINSGTLYITNDYNLGLDTLSLFIGGTLRTTNNITLLNRTLTGGTNGAAFEVLGDSTLFLPSRLFTATGALTKLGSGTLVFSNATTTAGGIISMLGGTTIFDSGARFTNVVMTTNVVGTNILGQFLATNIVYVARETGNVARLVIRDAQFIANGDMMVGHAVGSTGQVY
ncbi:MAG: hypothetical protein N2439_12540, partial [Anaerolineae bacterium]|nr:hypothetical protein [Anaerolineae bacterium]